MLLLVAAAPAGGAGAWILSQCSEVGLARAFWDPSNPSQPRSKPIRNAGLERVAFNRKHDASKLAFEPKREAASFESNLTQHALKVEGTAH